ncbi:O-antigen polymerase [Flavobacterium sp. FlaQc-57]|uniref:O-antigen polymerase n=1 Tax=Flavobacterium sp. FlaQc-57 TaxID=3374186 RepID=UPI003757015A
MNDLKKENLQFNKMIKFYLYYAVLVSLVNLLNFSIIFYYAVSLLFIPLTFYYLFKVIKIKNLFLIIIVLSMSFWNIITVLRGLVFDFSIIGRMLTSSTYFFPMIIPFFSLLKFNTNVIKQIINVIVVLDLFFLGFVVLLLFVLSSDLIEIINTYEGISKFFVYPNTFLLLNFYYLKPKHRIISIISFLVPLLIAMFLARRGQIFYFSISLFFSLLLNVTYFNKRKIIRNSLLIVIFGIIGFYVINLFSANISKTFSLLTERIDSDTRGTVEDCFYSDMTFTDFVFGKGIDGRFYCPGADTDYDNNTTSLENSGYRYNIETGYLDVILKGGFISLFIYFLVNIVSIVKGGLFSTNGLVKACSLYLVINLACVWIENSQAFTLRYILVWLCIGICFSKEIKSISNQELKKSLG